MERAVKHAACTAEETLTDAHTPSLEAAERGGSAPTHRGQRQHRALRVGANEPTSDSQEALPAATDPEASTPVKSQQVVVVTVRSLLATLFSVSIIIVSAVAFFPAYWMSFRDSFTAVRSSQRETVSGLAVTIDSFLSRSTAATIASLTLLHIEAPQTLPANHTDLLAPMANVFSLPSTRSFIGTLALIVAIPGHEWRAIAYSPITARASTPVVCYQSGLSTPCQWRSWNAPRAAFEPLLSDAPDYARTGTPQMTLKDILEDQHGIFQQLVVPWNASANKTSSRRNHGGAADQGPPSTDAISPRAGVTAAGPAITHWSRSDEHPNTFCDLVVPFPVVDADGRHGLAYWEATLQSRRILKEALLYYTEAFKRHSYFAVMDMRSRLISLNSWNQSGHQLLQAFPVSEINVPLMRKAVAHYLLHDLPSDDEATEGGSWGTSNQTTLADLHPGEVSFDYAISFRGDQCQVFVHTIQDSAGAALVVLVATLESDLFAPVTLTMRVLFATVALTIAFTVCALSLFLTKLGTRVYHLIDSLEETLLLQVDDGETDGSEPTPRQKLSRKAYVPFKDLLTLSDALDRLRRRVQEVKTILPDSLIMEAPTSSGASNIAMDLNSSSTSTAGGTTSSLPTDPIERSRLRHRARLNLAVFNDKVNVFHRRYCTCLWACRSYTNSINEFSFEEFFEAGYAASMEFDGCLEFFRPDYIVISFGAHIHMPMHSAQASLCALSFWNRLSERNRSQLVFLLDSHEFCVGTCGKENGRKRRVVFDVTAYMEMLRFLVSNDIHNVTVTQRAVAHIPEYLSVPFNLLKTSARNPQVLFELRGPVPVDAETGAEDSVVRGQMEQDAILFRKAFHQMRRGHYSEAMALYNQISARDSLAARLEAHCAERVAKHYTAPFVSRPPDVRFHMTLRCLTSPFLRPVMLQYVTLNKGVSQASTSPVARRVSSSGGRDRKGAAQIAPDHQIAPSQTVAASTSPFLAEGHASMKEVRPERSQNNSTGDELSVSHSGWPIENDPKNRSSVDALKTRTAAGEQSSDLSSAAAAAQDSLTTPLETLLQTFFENRPSEILDSNGTLWIVTLKPLGYTAVGAWYAGLSEEGMQARIEIVPRHCTSLSNVDVITSAESLVELKHANVLQYIGYHITNAYIALITEDARGGSLRDILSTFGPLDYLTVRRYTLDVLLALVYLHKMETVHGDINLSTVFIGGEGVCKVAEVGQRVMFDRPSSRNASGGPSRWANETVVHMPPEVADGEPWTTASDVYSLGVLVLELVLGFVPMRWKGGSDASMQLDVSESLDDVNTLAGHIATGELVIAIPEGVANSVAVFTRACCHRDPEKRATAQELLSFPLVL